MNYKQVSSFDNFMIANMTLGLLQQNEVDCHLKDENIVTIDPLLNHAVGGIKLMVAEIDFAAAVVLIREAEENYLKEIICPRCQTKSLEIKETTNNPQTFWGKLKNQIAYGQTELYKKEYFCTKCQSIYSEIPVSF